jgi:vancomycin resistance protein VanW
MKKRIIQLLKNYDTQKLSYSIKIPLLRWFFIFVRRTKQKIDNLNYKLAKKKWDYKKYINVRHQSVLMRKLGDVDMKLQENKVVNLKLAIKELNWLIINPWEVFSFWEIIWKPTYKKWYLDWIVINHWWVSRGVWWGLCQLSNLLYWMFLHLDVEILERHRHSYDIFPDSWRVLPFASWATVFYNYIDLKIKNTLDFPIQIKLWTDEKYLKWQILSDFPRKEKYHVYEKYHTFIKNNNRYFRYNIINREKIISWKKIKSENILENFSPVKYEIDENKLKNYWYTILEI